MLLVLEGRLQNNYPLNATSHRFSGLIAQMNEPILPPLPPLPTLASKSAEWLLLLALLASIAAGVLLALRAYCDKGGVLPLNRRCACLRLPVEAASDALPLRYYARRWVSPTGAAGERVQKWMQARDSLRRCAAALTRPPARLCAWRVWANCCRTRRSTHCQRSHRRAPARPPAAHATPVPSRLQTLMLVGMDAESEREIDPRLSSLSRLTLPPSAAARRTSWCWWCLTVAAALP